jgi:NADH pyrophosphatase NudC (nudix superfamily)
MYRAGFDPRTCGGRAAQVRYINILEETLIREIREEVGIEVYRDMSYVESKLFLTDNGQPVVDVVFLCRYLSGTPTIGDPGEVSSIQWLTIEEVLDYPKLPQWVRQSIQLAEQQRICEDPNIPTCLDA